MNRYSTHHFAACAAAARTMKTGRRHVVVFDPCGHDWRPFIVREDV